MSIPKLMLLIAVAVLSSAVVGAVFYLILK